MKYYYLENCNPVSSAHFPFQLASSRIQRLGACRDREWYKLVHQVNDLDEQSESIITQIRANEEQLHILLVSHRPIETIVLEPSNSLSLPHENKCATM